ncbi:hypothetical protein [Bartonella gliris]
MACFKPIDKNVICRQAPVIQQVYYAQYLVDGINLARLGLTISP